MRHPKFLQNVLIGSAAALFAGTSVLPNHPTQSGPVLEAATAFVAGTPATAATTSTDANSPTAEVALATKSALDALASSVTKLSQPQALEDAFHSYYAYKTENPSDVKKPYLYFVDYGLPSTEARGYVFDMSSLTVIEGPFTVAHGRGSSTSQYGVPTKFSNASGSDATSLGLYVTKALYAFHGHTGGQSYSSVGVKLDGVSTGFNDKALGRGVVAHGAPYVTPTKAGRSEGCPAMEPARARRLLPKLADGSLVFLYAPNQQWLASDPWISADSNG
ncbi:MAG TPA: murein L,D-transpeptidase catalytic domain family protein [Gemmatimonadaceae bacterium]|jgi:hypothetical protein